MFTAHTKINQLDVGSKKVSSNNDICLIEKHHMIRFQSHEWTISATSQFSEYLIQGLMYDQLGVQHPLIISNSDTNHYDVDVKSTENYPPLTVISPKNLQHDQIISWVKSFKSQQTLYHQTGATQSAGFVTADGKVLTFECLNLTTCLYKLMGCLIKKHQEYAPTLLLSHRVLEGDVDLILKFNPQLLICQSAISANALEKLKAEEITVFGFCRKNKYNRYSNFHL